MTSILTVDDYPEFADISPQPFLFCPTKLNGANGYVLELGKYYWVSRHWGGHTVKRVRFLKITPKGYAFLTMDTKRLFKRPFYPDKYHWSAHKELLFYFSSDLSIFKESDDGVSSGQKIPSVSKEAFGYKYVHFHRKKAARRDRVA